jgi:hypothetical protein
MDESGNCMMNLQQEEATCIIKTAFPRPPDITSQCKLFALEPALQHIMSTHQTSVKKKKATHSKKPKMPASKQDKGLTSAFEPSRLRLLGIEVQVSFK